MYYIYVIESESTGKYYIGHTDNIERRLYEHNNSLNISYTSKYRPWKIKAVFEVSGDRGVAIKAEKFIKKQKSKIFLERICCQNKVDLPMAQLVRVPHLRD